MTPMVLGIMFSSLLLAMVSFMTWFFNRSDKTEETKRRMELAAKYKRAELDRAYRLNRATTWRDGGRSWTA